MALTHALSTNNYGPAAKIVATSAANGTHTTLASALADSSVGETVFLRDSVTENVTLPAGVNIACWQGGSLNTPTITGTLTMTTAGTCNISGIALQTNSAALLAVTGSAASIVNLHNCYLNCTNNTGITFSSSSASAQVNLYNCDSDLGTTGIAYFSHSSAGSMVIKNFSFFNSGGSSTASTCSSGILIISQGGFLAPITVSGTGAITLEYVNLASSSLNTTMLTAGGSGSQLARFTRFGSGTASAVSISQTLTMDLCEVNSTNTNAVTGAGTLVNGGISFTNSSSLINTTTQTARNFDVGGISFDGGTNILNVYTEGTFTPTLTGASVAGTTTYTAQNGYYTKIGNVVFVYATIVITAATGTGDLLFGALPFTVKNDTNNIPIGSLSMNASGFAWPASTTTAIVRFLGNTTTAKISCFE